MTEWLLRLEQADLETIDEVLACESREWCERLHWNRDAVNRAALGLAAQRSLPGWLLMDGDGALGKVFVGVRRRSRSLEFPYVVPAHRGRGHLTHLVIRAVRALQTESRVGRIEIGCFPFDEALLGAELRALGLACLPRLYMVQEPVGVPPATETALPGGVRLAPWSAHRVLPGLLHSAYLGAPDRQAVELYATRAGCALYLEALGDSLACGRFDANLSVLAVDGKGRPRGFLLATRISRDTAHVAQIAVEPTWQGRHLGRALLAHYGEQARARGARRSTLLVTRENTRARSWYERLGYVTSGPFVCYWWDRSSPPSR